MNEVCVLKLCWIHPTTTNDSLAPLWEKLDHVIRPILRDGTELEFRFLEKSGNFVRSLYAEHLNSVHIVEAAMKAEADGFDGVFIGCWNDPLWKNASSRCLALMAVWMRSRYRLTSDL